MGCEEDTYRGNKWKTDEYMEYAARKIVMKKGD